MSATKESFLVNEAGQAPYSTNLVMPQHAIQLQTADHIAALTDTINNRGTQPMTQAEQETRLQKVEDVLLHVLNALHTIAGATVAVAAVMPGGAPVAAGAKIAEVVTGVAGNALKDLTATHTDTGALDYASINPAVKGDTQTISGPSVGDLQARIAELETALNTKHDNGNDPRLSTLKE